MSQEANAVEISFKNNFRSSIVLAFLGALGTVAVISYFLAWIKITGIYIFFEYANTPLQWIVSSFRLYLLIFETMLVPFSISWAVSMFAGSWGIIVLYRYLKQSDKKNKLILSCYALSWFIFMALPLWSYLPILVVWILIYYWALDLKPKVV